MFASIPGHGKINGEVNSLTLNYEHSFLDSEFVIYHFFLIPFYIMIGLICFSIILIVFIVIVCAYRQHRSCQNVITWV